MSTSFATLIRLFQKEERTSLQGEPPLMCISKFPDGLSLAAKDSYCVWLVLF
jgi:hypothetical protein